MSSSYTGQYPQGLTIRELKALLSGAPETDENGDEYEVWIETCRGTSSIVAKTGKLNGGDLLLETAAWVEREDA